MDRSASFLCTVHFTQSFLLNNYNSSFSMDVSDCFQLTMIHILLVVKAHCNIVRRTFSYRLTFVLVKTFLDVLESCFCLAHSHIDLTKESAIRIQHKGMHELVSK